MALLTEVHSTHLITPCFKKVELTAQGKAIGECATALYQGLVGHKALERIHKQNLLRDFEILSDEILDDAMLAVEDECERDRRPLTEVVKRDRNKIHKDLTTLIGCYCSRLADYFDQCDMLGVEVPCRITIKDPRLAVNGHDDTCRYASHFDLLFRDATGQLRIWDWKFQDEAPTMAFLGRNLQFILYYLCAGHGTVCLDQELGIWEDLEEFPEMAWIHMPYFKPFGRATPFTLPGHDEPTQFKKGDTRPIEAIVKTWTFSPQQEDAMIDEIIKRPIMDRLGIYPTTPDRIACQKFCECRSACPAMHRNPAPTL